MTNLPILLNILGDMEGDSSYAYPLYNYGYGGGYRPRRNHHDPEPYVSLLDYALPLSILNAQRQLARRHSEAKGLNEKHSGVSGGGAAAGPVSQIGKDGFQVCLDVAQFKPNELNVKVVDNSIIVEGKHEEREDEHGYIQRHFVRRYSVPKGYDADKVVSTLSSDGVLTVSIPKPQAVEDKSTERIIQIQQTGPAHLNIKDNSKDDAEPKKDDDEDAKSKL